MADDRYEAYCRMHNLDAIEILMHRLEGKVSTPDIIYTFYDYLKKHPKENLSTIIKLIQIHYGII